jgi:hypothetical protein
MDALRHREETDGRLGKSTIGEGVLGVRESVPLRCQTLARVQRQHGFGQTHVNISTITLIQSLTSFAPHSRPNNPTRPIVLSSDMPASNSDNEPADREPLSHRFHTLISDACKAVFSHARNHIGVGLICAVAYFDP